MLPCTLSPSGSLLPGFKHHLRAKDLQRPIPGLNLFFALQTHILIYKQLPQCLHQYVRCQKTSMSKTPFVGQTHSPTSLPPPPNHTARRSARHPAHLQPPFPPLAPFQPSCTSVSPVNFTLVSQSIFPSSTAIPTPHHLTWTNKPASPEDLFSILDLN